MNISVDVGYGYTKAVTEDGRRIMFPSLVAPAKEFMLDDLTKSVGSEYITAIKPVNGQSQKYFVGELARRESRTASFPFDREKHLHPYHDVVLLTAVALLCSPKRPEVINLAVGLPINCYKTQKDLLRNHLLSISDTVSVSGGEPKWISLNNVIVYPQGAGALLTVENLPEYGKVAVVDIGFKTTDFMVIEMVNGKPYPVSDLSDSIEIGMNFVHRAIADGFFSLTGNAIDPALIPTAVYNNTICYRGREIDVTEIVRSARSEAARAIADRLLTAWAGEAELLRKIYLAGGGAVELKELKNYLPAAEIIRDSQFANALGFLKAIPRIVSATVKPA